MTVATEFLPFATAGGANVQSQAAFQAATTTDTGFIAGIAPSANLNKVWRQSSVMAAAIANFIMNELAVDVPDDGNMAGLITNLTNAIKVAALSNETSSQAANGWIKFASGLILQWGQHNTATGNNDYIVFPEAFPLACFNVIVTEGAAGGWGSGPPSPVIYGVNSLAAAGFHVSGARLLAGTPTFQSGLTFNFMAVGH